MCLFDCTAIESVQTRKRRSKNPDMIIVRFISLLPIVNSHVLHIIKSLFDEKINDFCSYIYWYYSGCILPEIIWKHNFRTCAHGISWVIRQHTSSPENTPCLQDSHSRTRPQWHPVYLSRSFPLCFSWSGIERINTSSREWHGGTPYRFWWTGKEKADNYIGGGHSSYRPNSYPWISRQAFCITPNHKMQEVWKRIPATGIIYSDLSWIKHKILNVSQSLWISWV